MKPSLPVLLLLIFLMSNCSQRKYGNLTRWTSSQKSKQINESRKQTPVKNPVVLEESVKLKVRSASRMNLSLDKKANAPRQVKRLTKAKDRGPQHSQLKVLEWPTKVKSAMPFTPKTARASGGSGNFMTVILLLFLALTFTGLIGGIFGIAWWKVLLIGLGIMILGGMMG